MEGRRPAVHGRDVDHLDLFAGGPFPEPSSGQRDEGLHLVERLLAASDHRRVLGHHVQEHRLWPFIRLLATN